MVGNAGNRRRLEISLQKRQRPEGQFVLELERASEAPRIPPQCFVAHRFGRVVAFRVRHPEPVLIRARPAVLGVAVVQEGRDDEGNRVPDPVHHPQTRRPRRRGVPGEVAVVVYPQRSLVGEVAILSAGLAVPVQFEVDPVGQPPGLVVEPDVPLGGGGAVVPAGVLVLPEPRRQAPRSDRRCPHIREGRAAHHGRDQQQHKPKLQQGK